MRVQRPLRKPRPRVWSLTFPRVGPSPNREASGSVQELPLKPPSTQRQVAFALHRAVSTPKRCPP